ncbi:translesion error-prone DNA polymerase V autoproteolytic subunit [Marinobacter sp. DY40_1A1]|uniref:translesion error-prone DNA polymerase V autoproteolytic subunit n=1 Tax=Marinobacter sp. DY40_1A1 TaxID=2583229 RepID=UPI00190554AF|nr:translesion error-prone DNA polymerase V autoproteolytic subunit [Marinobacter sp. DY40_1A1]MBK1887775.1 translesion error-prone DNA polymerase V autoproteolytic subunit [Marinobacter sp. DY40_1A1]
MPVTLLGDHKSLSQLGIPFFLERVSAGFPSPAEDYVEKTLDLNELCIQHPAATFFVRVQGESMVDAGIYPGDVLVVDRSLRAAHGDIIIASLESEMTVKQLHLTPPPVLLLPRNSAYTPITIEGDMVMEVFGVVTNVVRSLKRGGNS